MTSPMTPHLEKIARAFIDEQERWFVRTNKMLASPRDEICRNVDDEREIEVIKVVPRGDGSMYVWDMRNIAAMRAALSALLPPSEEMVQAMRWHTYDPGFPEQAIKAFTAAIQSILAEGEGP